MKTAHENKLGIHRSKFAIILTVMLAIVALSASGIKGSNEASIVNDGNRENVVLYLWRLSKKYIKF